jgi:hypothetical protein
MLDVVLSDLRGEGYSTIFKRIRDLRMVSSAVSKLYQGEELTLSVH